MRKAVSMLPRSSYMVATSVMLMTHSASTYQIPAISDAPIEMHITLLPKADQEGSIHGSKASGEPPLMLAASVLHALSDAIASAADYRLCPRLDAPATPERVLFTIEDLRRRALEAAE